MKWRKLNRVLHRDLGYFFAGMIIIYAVSGIALNHIGDWNPNYIITKIESPFTPTDELINNEKKAILDFLESFENQNRKNYKSHYRPSQNSIKIFLKDNESLLLNFETNKVTFESIKKRPFFFQINFLHYNPGKWWKWFSDIFAASLIIITITGLLILKGKNGITRRGAILVIAGILIPVLFLMLR